VSWNVTDEDGSSASLFLNYSAVGGVDGFPAQVFAETLATGVNALSWKVPALDSLGLVLRLTAVDADGHVGWNSTRTLQVDSTPPVPFLRHTGNLTAGSRLTFDASASFDAVSSIARYRWRFWSEAKGLLGLATDVTAAHSFEAAGDYLVTLEVWDAAGNVAAKTERIPIGSASGTGGDVTVVAAAGGSALGLLALAGGAAATSQPVRTWGLKHLILPLYVRLKPDAVSNQQTRGMIIGYIKVHPGDSYSDIKNNLELSSGALTYHLDVLERERLVRSRNKGSRKLYYPADASMPEDGGGLHELQLRMLKVAEEQPGLSVRDLSGVLGVRPQLAIYHARVLQLSGRIRLERVGLRTRVYRVRDGVVVREAKAPDT
jgi:DNA-binding MarR family transcriptional regulator